MRIKFFIPGHARPAGSKSAFKHPHTGKLIVTHANPATKAWMDTVRFFGLEMANRMIPLTEAVRLSLEFLKERPKNHYGSGRNEGVLKRSAPLFMTSTPDLTKLTRAVEDGLTGIIWKDDSQVVEQATRKRYVKGDERPGVWVLVETIEDLKGCHYEQEIRTERAGLFGCLGR